MAHSSKATSVCTTAQPPTVFKRVLFWCAATILMGSVFACGSTPRHATSDKPKPRRPPNILLVIADDLGYAEVGCYGQRTIRTPHIDELSRRGVRFVEAYSGSCVCAPSRCTLLTGRHTGHCEIRDNKELAPTGQQPLGPDALTLAQMLRSQGYATGVIGKWGLGPPGSTGDPSRQGFDHFFGYLCQRHAHNHCPAYLYRNAERVELAGNKDRWESGVVIPGSTYAPDLFRDEAVRFIDEHRDRPFFLLFATPVPHAAIQVPDDSLAPLVGTIPDAPYDGSKGYLKHPTPRAGYAAMVTRMDDDFGQILRRLRELGLEQDTIVIFTSDNGPTFNGGTDSTYFESTAGLRGLKCQLYEGGIRVPLIIAWPERIRVGVSHGVTANWDLFPTLIHLAGLDASRLPETLDGIDLTPQLVRTDPLPQRESLYWEYHAGGGWQAVRLGDFKGVRRHAKKQPDGPIELYHLARDPHETTDVAAEHPAIVARIRAIMAARTRSPVPEWNFGP